MWRLLFLLLPAEALADSLIATRTIRAQATLGPEDVTVVAAEIAGAVTETAAALGQEARVAIYAGQPVLASDIGPPARVERNQIVALTYVNGPLAILAEGRALGRGGTGDVIRVMNLASRTTVSGRVAADGSVHVGF